MSADRLFPCKPWKQSGLPKRMVEMAARSQAGSCLSGLRICGKPIPSPKFAACLIIQLNHQFPRGNYNILNTHSLFLSLSSRLVVLYRDVHDSLRRNSTEKRKWQEERSSLCKIWEGVDNFVALRKAKGKKRSCSLDRLVWLLDVKYC